MDKALSTSMYASMLRIRRVEEQIAARYSDQEMRCPVHLSIGQEAVAVGICQHLNIADKTISAHRSHAHYLAKGGDLKAMLAELYGKESGCAGGRGGSMHLIDLDQGHIAAVPIVGSAIPIGAGVAWAQKLKGGDAVTVIFFGDGATEEGAFYETLNFCALQELPVLFVCENNLYSVYSPLEARQPRGRSITGIAQAHGMVAYEGDGNDVEAVFRLGEAALSQVREHRQPVLLELATYRWLEHCGPDCDDHLEYRPAGELVAWKERCPVARQQERILTAGMIDQPGLTEMERSIAEEIDQAFQFACNSAFPDVNTLDQYVYAT